MDGSPGRYIGLMAVLGGCRTKAKWEDEGYFHSVRFSFQWQLLQWDAGLSLPSSGRNSLFRKTMRFMAAHGGSELCWGVCYSVLGCTALLGGCLHLSRRVPSPHSLEIAFPT